MATYTRKKPLVSYEKGRGLMLVYVGSYANRNRIGAVVEVSLVMGKSCLAQGALTDRLIFAYITHPR